MWNYIQSLLHMSKGVSRFIISESILGISLGLYIMVFNLHLLESGFNETEIGQITSLGTLVTGIFSIPIGLLANYFGRKKLLVTGLILMGIGYLSVGLGKEQSTFYIAQVIASLGITFLITSEIQLLFSYSRSKKEETQAFSMLFATFTLFTGVGTLLGGILPRFIGGKTTIYQSSIILAGILVLSVALIRGFILPKEEKTNIEPKLSLLKGYKKQMFNKSIWMLSFYTLIIGASYAIVTPYLNIIVKFRYDWNDEWVSLLLTINGFFLFLGSFFMPYLLERWGSKKTYLIVYVTTISLSVLLFASIPASLFSILLLTRGGSFTMLNNMIESQAMQSIDEEDRNVFAGIKTVLRSIGAALANLTAGMILASKNYSLPFLISGILLIVGYIYYIMFVSPIFEEKNKSENITELCSS